MKLKYLFIIFVIFILVSARWFFFDFKNDPPSTSSVISIPPSSEVSEITQTADTPPESSENTNPPSSSSESALENIQTLPEYVNLKVPFTSQSPHQNWNMPYQEFCEEASMLMAASYAKSQTISDPEDADKKLKALQKFEMEKLGFYQDTTIEETAMVLREYFNLKNIAIINNPSITDIQNALAENKVLILPFAGQQLGNPNFKQPGPIYHMLVVKGYTKSGDFITNDPGTRKGADYIYKASVLMNALHDWNGGNVTTGKKIMISVE
ncbi:MAG: Uncharacterized protein Athens071425_95 [Parcubacteria group bacterium Athens0714_25]|nr:MAG: Uncharacterized protein Athens071425_95 [Parcubacteria group bacterium Athens0714_25]